MLKRRDVYLCFDRYRSYSTKRVTRSGRATQASNFHHLSLSMPLTQQKVVLSVTENKRQPIKVICDELIHVGAFHKEHTSLHRLIVIGGDDTPVEIHKAVVMERSEIRTTHKEADDLLAQQMFVSANEHQKRIPVISDVRGLQIFSRLVSRSDPWSKKWWVIF